MRWLEAGSGRQMEAAHYCWCLLQLTEPRKHQTRVTGDSAQITLPLKLVRQKSQDTSLKSRPLGHFKHNFTEKNRGPTFNNKGLPIPGSYIFLCRMIATIGHCSSQGEPTEKHYTIDIIQYQWHIFIFHYRQ